VNIAAYMTACNVTDLDSSAKSALRAVAGRANQHTGRAWVSTTRIAADMGVSWRTAKRALDRLIEAGYVTVDKSCGKRSGWQLTPVIHDTRPLSPRPTTPVTVTGVRINGEVLRSESAHAVGENLPVLTSRQRHALDPVNIVDCPHCDEFGWVWRGDVIRGRCSHQPLVTGLTLDDILDRA
jgi:hypothetical protein